ncbi:MAG: hypothetical protein ACLFQM_03795 [Fidelibacterota bacterium]
MIKRILSVAVIIMITISCIFAQNYTRFKSKSGIIEYTMTGTIEGKTTLYWDDYGYKSLNIHDTKTTIMGMSSKSNYKELTLGREIYSWEEENDYISKSENPFAEKWENENYNKKDFDEFNQKSLESLGYKKIGEEKIQGKNCEVWEGIGKIWVWKDQGVSMKTELNALGTSTLIEVADMKLNKKVNKDLFKYPGDKKIVEEDSGELDDEDIDPQTMQDLLKGFNMQKSQRTSRGNSPDTVQKADEDFEKEVADGVKEAAKEGAKEGVKEAAKEEAKDASKNAVKSLIKGLFD